MSEEILENIVPCDLHRYSFLKGEKSSQTFLKNIFEEAQPGSLVSFTLPIETIDPLACLELLDDGRGFHYFWEKPDDSFAIAAGSTLVEIRTEGKKRFSEVRRQIAEIRENTFEYSVCSHSHSGLHFLGGFSFFDENKSEEWNSFGAASFTVPRWQVIKEGKFTMLTLNFKVSDFDHHHQLADEIEQEVAQFSKILERSPKLENTSGNNLQPATEKPPSKEAFTQWSASITKAKELIRQQKFDKIVIARKTSIQLQQQLKPTHVANSLREKFPDCYTFLIRKDDRKTFLGSTPERLASFNKNYMLTEALAGSMRRGATASEDAVLEKELLHSSKNASEHNYVVKAIEQGLESLVRKIKKDRKPVIKKLSNVQHLFTSITAWLKEETDLLAVIEQLHPTPAVGGYPWKAAESYLSELEHFDRGWYAGPVGWLNSNSNGEFAVAIRSSLITDDRADFYAGCGIVEDSDAETEWQETILKLSPMLSALQYD